MMEVHEFVLKTQIDIAILDKWVEAGWLTSRQNGADQHFSEIDLARAHLIRDLQVLGVNDEGVPIILDLVDQLHGLRHVLRELLSAIKTQRQEEDRA